MIDEKRLAEIRARLDATSGILHKRSCDLTVADLRARDAVKRHAVSDLRWALAQIEALERRWAERASIPLANVQVAEAPSIVFEDEDEGAWGPPTGGDAIVSCQYCGADVRLCDEWCGYCSEEMGP